jgi:hypothetical protein
MSEFSRAWELCKGVFFEVRENQEIVARPEPHLAVGHRSRVGGVYGFAGGV